MAASRAFLRLLACEAIAVALGLPLVLWLQPPPVVALAAGSGAVLAGMVAGALTL